MTGRFLKLSDALANGAWRERKRIDHFLRFPRTRPSRAPAMGRRWTVPPGRLLAKQSIPVRLGLLVTGMVLPLTVFAVVLVYYNYEGNRRTAYDRILQIARGVATNIDESIRGGARHDHLRWNRGAVGVHSRPTLRMECCGRNSEVIPHN